MVAGDVDGERKGERLLRLEGAMDVLARGSERCVLQFLSREGFLDWRLELIWLSKVIGLGLGVGFGRFVIEVRVWNMNYIT